MPTSLVCFDRGSGFSAGSLVTWSVTALPTIYVSSNQLKARVPSASIASHTRARIAVSNGAATSNNGLLCNHKPGCDSSLATEIRSNSSMPLVAALETGLTSRVISVRLQPYGR